MDKTLNLEPKEIDTFSKIINEYIAYPTSTSLSTLLSEPINYKVMILDKRFFNSKNVKLPSDEIQMCGISLGAKGDINIEICYAIKMKYAKKIAAKLLEQEVEEIDEMGTSALQEVANILTGSFFNGVSTGTGFRVDISTPNYLQSDLKSMVNESTKHIVKQTESVIIADAELVGEKSGIRIHMIIIQNSNDVRKFLDQNSKENPSEFSSLSDREPFITGSQNSELDDLVNELQKEKT